MNRSGYGDPLTGNRVRWLVPTLLALVFVLLTLDFWLGDSGVLSNRQLRDEILQMKLQNDRLLEEQRVLYESAQTMKDDPLVIERLARERLGWITEGEIFIRTLPTDGQ
jgi:cell division protein FtsB